MDDAQSQRDGFLLRRTNRARFKSMIIDGAQIRAGRAMLGWLQHELAAAADLHWNTVAALEKREALTKADRRRCWKALSRIESALKDHGVIMLSAKGSPGIVLSQV